MKKILIFLMTILCIGIKCQDVSALTNFYEAEKIDGIFTKSVDGANTHYQKARFFRRTSDNKEAYCLEPFAFFDESKNYQEYNYATNLSNSAWQRITLIANYGYGYGNHTDPKWYAITQLMIWQVAEPTKEFYFTSYLNGPKIDAYTNEINEINNLIKDYETVPSIPFGNNSVVGSTITLTDTKQVLNNYYIENPTEDIKIENNQLIIKNIKEGKNSFIIKRKSTNESTAALFYYNGESQNLMTKGNIGEKVLQINVNGTTNKIILTKTDEDNNSTTPQGEASLTGAVYNLYNEKDELLQEIEINKNNKTIIENLNYGKYYLQEKKAGTGYTLNKDKYYFEVNMNTKEINLTLKNKVIEKEVTIHKEFGDQSNTTSEKNISFDIYNSKGELVNTITTDDFGNAKITLPYGKYTVKQRNTNYGYKMVDDFIIDVNDTNNDYYYQLYDYKIEVPDTRIKENSSIGLLIIMMLIFPSGIYLRKKYVS